MPQSAGLAISCSSNHGMLSDKNLLSVELGDSLATLGHRVLREVAREDEPDRGLDFAGAQSVPIVHINEAGAFAGDPLEDVGDKRVHDEHGLVRDTDVRVHLLEDLEDVR